MAEIKYGVLFKDCDFRVKFEPTGSKGPDLLVTRDEMSAFVEVKRYRPKEGEELPQDWGPDETLLSYGDPFNAQCAFETDLTRKLQQIKLPIGIQHAILAVWSDRECFEEIEFEAAVRAISIEAAKKEVRFCMYGSLWVDPKCVEVGLANNFQSWMDDLQQGRRTGHSPKENDRMTGA